MQTHFPFCFFCFSVTSFFSLILKVFAACFQSVSGFIASAMNTLPFDAIWNTGVFKIVDSTKSLLKPSMQRLSAVKFSSKEKSRYKLQRTVSLWLHFKFWLSVCIVTLSRAEWFVGTTLLASNCYCFWRASASQKATT